VIVLQLIGLILCVQDFQLWCDLRAFEQTMGCRYLTHCGDEERWIRFTKERGLDFPPHLCWDPDM